MDKPVTHLLQGTRARVVIAMAQRIASGEPVADVAHDYTGDGEQVTAEELAEDFGPILALLDEVKDLRAKLADVNAAIERNARIRRSEWTDDDRLFVADFTSEAAQFLAEMLLARLDMENAPNYAEVRTEDLGSLHVALTGLQIDMCFRRAGAPTPHELRVKAERERDDALALAEERRVRLMFAGRTLKADTDEADDLAEESLEICRILGIDVGGDYDLIATLHELVTQRDNLLSGAQRVTEALAKAKMLQAKDTWHQDAAGAIRAFVNLLAETTQWQKEGHRAEADLARIATYAGLSENATAAEIIAELETLAEVRPVPGPHATTHSTGEPEPPKVNNPAPKADFSILACAHPEELPWLVAREFGALTERIVVLERRVDNLVCEIAALKGGR